MGPGTDPPSPASVRHCPRIHWGADAVKGEWTGFITDTHCGARGATKDHKPLGHETSDRYIGIYKRQLSLREVYKRIRPGDLVWRTHDPDLEQVARAYTHAAAPV